MVFQQPKLSLRTYSKSTDSDALVHMALLLWHMMRYNKLNHCSPAPRCFKDCCPHRLAPLSEGRIDHQTGNLYCNYHGWQFDSTGSCTNIPQLSPNQPINIKAACVARFPTKAAEGLLWVWADSSPAAEIDSAAAAWPGIASELDEKGEATFSTGKHRWFAR